MTGRTLPTPSFTWEIGPEGSVSLVGGAKGRPLTRRQRAKSTCRACGAVGHNARNKKCPKAAP